MYQIEMELNGMRCLLEVAVEDPGDVLQRFEQARMFYQTKGFSLPAVVSVAPQSTSVAQQQDARPAPQAQPGMVQCPFHGTQKIKSGYQGRGWECGVNVQQEPSYPFRQWTGRDGGQMYTCNWKSS